MNLTFIETQKTTVQEKVKKDNGRGKEVEVLESKEVDEEVPVIFESHKHEVLISAISRYTRVRKKRMPPEASAWFVWFKGTDKRANLLKTVGENGITEETKLELRAA